MVASSPKQCLEFLDPGRSSLKVFLGGHMGNYLQVSRIVQVSFQESLACVFPFSDLTERGCEREEAELIYHHIRNW